MLLLFKHGDTFLEYRELLFNSCNLTLQEHTDTEVVKNLHLPVCAEKQHLNVLVKLNLLVVEIT